MKTLNVIEIQEGDWKPDATLDRAATEAAALADLVIYRKSVIKDSLGIVANPVSPVEARIRALQAMHKVERT